MKKLLALLLLASINLHAQTYTVGQVPFQQADSTGKLRGLKLSGTANQAVGFLASGSLVTINVASGTFIPTLAGTGTNTTIFSGTFSGTTSIVNDLNVGTGTNSRAVIINQATSTGFGMPGAFNVNSNGDKEVFFDNTTSYDGRMGVGTQSNLWVKSLVSTGTGGSFEVYTGNTPTLTLSVSQAGVNIPSAGLIVGGTATSIRITAFISGTTTLTSGSSTFVNPAITTSSNIGSFTLVSASGARQTPYAQCFSGSAIITGLATDNGTWKFIITNTQ